MNERISIYLDCLPKESLEEFCKRFYRCDISPTTLAKAVWNVFKKGYICPQDTYDNGKLVLFGFTDTPLAICIKKYSDTFKAVNLGEI